MKHRMVHLAIAIALVLPGSGTCAQDLKLPATPTAKQLVDEIQTWDIHTVQYSRMFWQVLLGNDDLRSAAPPLPEPGDDLAKWREAVREHTALLQKRLGARLGDLPAGTLFLLDVDSGTLAARASREVMQRLSYLAGLEDRHQPQTIGCELEILELPTRLLGPCIANGVFNTPFDLERTLRAFKTDSRTKVRTRVQWDVPPVDRFMVRTGRELESAWRLVLHKDGTIEPMTWHRGFDSNLEAEATYSPAGDFIELLFDLKHHDQPPVRKDLFVGQVAGTLKATQTVYNSHVFSATTEVTIANGTTTLLGFWTPWQQPEVIKLAYVTVHSLPVMPHRRDDLGKILASVEDQLPAIQPAGGLFSVPAGMVVHTYNCRIDFLGLSLLIEPDGSGGSVDPFASVPEADDDSHQREIALRRTARLVAPREMLRSQGIEFPAGSWAVYHQPSKQLVVVQHPDGHERIQAFFDSSMAHTQWNTIASLQLVEGSADTLRTLEAESGAASMDESVWTKAQKLLSTGRLKTLGMLRTSGNDGTIFNLAAGPEEVNASVIHPGPGTYKDDGSPPVEGVAHMDLEEEIRGTRFEAEFEGAPDGDSFVGKLDLLHHLPSKPGAAPRFHHLVVTLPVQKAVPKLIGIWPRDEPSGKDEGGVMQAAFLRVDVVPVIP